MEIENIVDAVGALGEILGVYRDSLLKNGFTRNEAIVLCEDFADFLCDLGCIGLGEEEELE